MLQAFQYNKVGRWMSKSPWQIEDLLTSVFFGTCEYAGLEAWNKVLFPVLSEAMYVNPYKEQIKQKEYEQLLMKF